MVAAAAAAAVAAAAVEVETAAAAAVVDGLHPHYPPPDITGSPLSLT